LSQASINPTDYRALQDFLKKAIGLALGDNRQYLVETRLRPLLSEYRLDGFGELLEGLRNGQPQALREHVIEAMTTQETSWLRDRYPFVTLEQTILPSLDHRKRLRIWSAACSTGQEAYSIAMIIHGLKQARPCRLQSNVDILATDVSQNAIKEAIHGCYPKTALTRGLSTEQIQRYFRAAGDCWQVSPQLRGYIRFQVHNLLNSYALLGRFDVIFCRNTLIYFEQSMRCDILRRIAQTLTPGGFLILGGSESVGECAPELAMAKTAGGVYYHKRETAASAAKR